MKIFILHHLILFVYLANYSWIAFQILLSIKKYHLGVDRELPSMATDAISEVCQKNIHLMDVKVSLNVDAVV